MIPIVDFHCDLLLYLNGDAGRTAFDRISRCSCPQMREGGVKLQILPISETLPDSSEEGEKQFRLFSKLANENGDHFEVIRKTGQLEDFAKREKIGILLAVENASTWCDEEDDLQKQLKRLEAAEKEHSKIVYMSFTWNFENRFGGGALTNVGLKEDGKALLDFLDGKRIAVDFSHTSDALASDILNYIDQKKLDIPIMASHSNSRTVHDVPRNLPDEFIKEIFQRGGVIGLNTIRSFVGASLENFTNHLNHLLDLGGQNQVCLGLDFFYEKDVAACFRKSVDQLFFSEFTDASCYPHLLALCRREIIEGLSHQNALSFLKSYILVP